MKLDKDKLSIYDLTSAKVGDTVIIGSISFGHSEWRFYKTTIKSISPKRGDITLANGKRYKKDECKMGDNRWGYSYDDKVFEYTQENIKIINNYIESINEIGYIVKYFREIEKQGFRMLYNGKLITEQRRYYWDRYLQEPEEELEVIGGVGNERQAMQVVQIS